ncbi:MAG: hypothetical protein ACMUIA_11140 [bacterium]
MNVQPPMVIYFIPYTCMFFISAAPVPWISVPTAQIVHLSLLAERQVFIGAPGVLRVFDWLVKNNRQIESWELFI